MKKVFSFMLLSAVMLSFSACGGDDEPNNTKLSKTAYTMYHEETQSIEGSNLSDITWDSENEFVAMIKDNVITGQFVGKTIVKSTAKNLSFTVEVKPKYHTYEEPYLLWGGSKSAIKAKYGTPASEDSGRLLYQTSNPNAPMMLYLFENGKMTTCGVVCKISAASQLGDFLVERYVPISVDTNKYSAVLVHCFGKLSDPQVDYGVAMQYSSSIGGILVAYSHVDEADSRNSDAIDFNKAFESLENAMK